MVDSKIRLNVTCLNLQDRQFIRVHIGAHQLNLRWLVVYALDLQATDFIIFPNRTLQ